MRESERARVGVGVVFLRLAYAVFILCVCMSRCGTEVRRNVSCRVVSCEISRLTYLGKETEEGRTQTMTGALVWCRYLLSILCMS